MEREQDFLYIDIIEEKGAGFFCGLFAERTTREKANKKYNDPENNYDLVYKFDSKEMARQYARAKVEDFGGVEYKVIVNEKKTTNKNSPLKQ